MHGFYKAFAYGCALVVEMGSFHDKCVFRKLNGLMEIALALIQILIFPCNTGTPCYFFSCISSSNKVYVFFLSFFVFYLCIINLL